MKLLSIICLIALVSCSHDRHPASAADGSPVAYDTVAFGNVLAYATKKMDKQDVCFDINLEMKGGNQQEIMPANWTVAWVDQQNNYHLINMNQRHPASTPEGGQVIAPYWAYQEWKNHFTACAPKANMNDVKSLVLTPKELPWKGHHEVTLNWN
ncbi:MAG: hypothetical protein ACJ76H_10930 [Bacteriovoracaceae bacterium]